MYIKETWVNEGKDFVSCHGVPQLVKETFASKAKENNTSLNSLFATLLDQV